MTVSRALRQDPSVADETRERIVAAAERLGYRPRANLGRPRQLKSKANPTVDIVLSVDVLASMFKTELLVSIEQELSRQGYDCVVRTVGDQYDQFLSLYEQLRHSKSQGTLLIGYVPIEQLMSILEFKPDAILVDHTGDPRLPPSHQSVAFDNVEGARIAVRHLLGIGRRRIALVTGDPDHFWSREVERGYREVLEGAGMKVDPCLIRCAGFHAGGARDAVLHLIDEGCGFDAVFTSDEMALGVFRALHERRVVCPGDVAVVGFDGLPIGVQLIPTLTTVKMDYRQLGEIAVRRVLAMGVERAVPCRIRLLPQLEVRESTSCTS
jgi:LacI family transcriptional regulator